MTYSFGLIWAVLLLAPGLAVYAAVFAGGGGSVIRATPPAPNSLSTIGIVVGSAAIGHFLWAMVSVVHAKVCQVAACPIALGFDPDPYGLAIGLVSNRIALSSPMLLYLMAQAAALTALAFLGVRRAMRTARVRSLTRGFLYGHLAGLVVEIDLHPPLAMTAFVLTKIRVEALTVGYEGLVESLALGTGKTIDAIALVSVEKFVVRLGRSGFRRGHYGSGEPISRLVIERAEIENIAFNQYAMPEASQAVPS